MLGRGRFVLRVLARGISVHGRVTLKWILYSQLDRSVRLQNLFLEVTQTLELQ